MELKYEFYIGATPERIWDILVTPEGTRQIFFGSILDSTFEVGAPFKYVGPGNDGDETVHVYGKVVDFKAQEILRYIEHPGPSYHENHEELESRVTFKLEVVGKCTKLTLTNDQWSENHPSIESTKQSWWMLLSNIKTLAETDKTLDFGW